ncbi:hypothetical protein ZWY2020_041150, partial [Hordeum vulgare]
SNQLHPVQSSLKLASELTESRKHHVARLGFRSFLEMTSVSNIESIYFCITNHFNTSSCSIEMANGFKFPITTSSVHKIFGIPIGGVPVNTKPSESTYEFINNEFEQLHPASTFFNYLDDLADDKFCESSFSFRYLRSLSPIQISYFDFLIITEFKLPRIEPRLPLWSENMLISYMALDALHDKNNEYGRLPDKIILQMHAQKFFTNIIRNSTPTLKTYVDDMHSLFLKTWTSSSSLNLQFKSAHSEKEIKVPTTKKLLAIEPPPNIPMLTVPTIIDEYKEININEILEHLVKDLPDFVNITSSNFSLRFNIPTSEELTLHPKNIGTPIEDHLLVKFSNNMKDSPISFQQRNLELGIKVLTNVSNLVDQNTITLSFKTGGCMNPRVVGCFAKLENKDQLNRGRKGLLPNSELVEHIVSPDDMVKMLVFKEKQWILIVANSKAILFDILNPYYNGDSFLTTISVVVYNFKTLFTATYGNSSLNIGNFESRFVAGPKVNFMCIFLLQNITKFKGVGLDFFSNDDIQALLKSLFEIITCNDNEIQLPLVTSFMQSHGFRIFK